VAATPDSLAFERLKAVQTPDGLHVTGQIVNLNAEEESYLLPLIISALSEEDVVMDMVIVPFETETIAAGAVQSFDKTLKNIAADAVKLRMRFAMPEEIQE
jgi:hypothetical protein